MNAPIDTLAFAERFESAGFAQQQARLLAAAFGEAQEAGRDDRVTKAYLKAELAELKLELVRGISTVGKDVSNRLRSTITIIAGVSTAISATVGAGVALLLKVGGL